MTAAKKPAGDKARLKRQIARLKDELALTLKSLEKRDAHVEQRTAKRIATWVRGPGASEYDCVSDDSPSCVYPKDIARAIERGEWSQE